MSRDERDYQLEQQEAILRDALRSLRQQEKNLKVREVALGSQKQFAQNGIKTLREELHSSLPPYMVPGNVGGINEVTWPFWEQMTFDFGTDPTYSTATKQLQSFQVDQEAALLLMSVARNYDTYDTAGALAPLQIELIDRSSSRRFNNAPIPIQMFGTKAKPTIFPTPMLITPNSFLDGVITSINPASQATTGSGRHHFSFFGLRVRIEDVDKVLSTIFG